MINLEPKELQIIQQCARESFSPGTGIWAYGSRVDGTNHDTSDLDLVVHPPRDKTAKTGKELMDFKERLQNSNLVILVDAFVWDDIPEKFQQRILKRYEVMAFEEKSS